MNITREHIADTLGLSGYMRLKKMTQSEAIVFLSEIDMNDGEREFAISLAKPDPVVEPHIHVVAPTYAPKAHKRATIWICGASYRQIARLHKPKPVSIGAVCASVRTIIPEETRMLYNVRTEQLLTIEEVEIRSNLYDRYADTVTTMEPVSAARWIEEQITLMDFAIDKM